MDVACDDCKGCKELMCYAMAFWDLVLRRVQKGVE